jgi:hypothetical protein
MDKYMYIFEMLTGLPPMRGDEHSILLKDGISLVSVHPSRYPQCQKKEIDKLMSEMLATGIIQPSTSPFSSSILLVRK